LCGHCVRWCVRDAECVDCGRDLESRRFCRASRDQAKVLVTPLGPILLLQAGASTIHDEHQSTV
jgi:hypothetical protein